MLLWHFHLGDPESATLPAPEMTDVVVRNFVLPKFPKKDGLVISAFLDAGGAPGVNPEENDPKAKNSVIQGEKLRLTARLERSLFILSWRKWSPDLVLKAFLLNGQFCGLPETRKEADRRVMKKRLFCAFLALAVPGAATASPLANSENTATQTSAPAATPAPATPAPTRVGGPIYAVPARPRSNDTRFQIDAAYASIGYGFIITDPDDGSHGPTFHGIPLELGISLDNKRHHTLGLELGIYISDRGTKEEWWRNHRHERYTRNTYLMPLLFSYRYAHTFELGKRDSSLTLYGGPTGGMFLFIDHRDWEQYDPNYYNYDEDTGSWLVDLFWPDDTRGTWRSERSRTRGSATWATGAGAGFSYQVGRGLFIDWGYSFLYTGEHKIFNRRVGKSQNHQVKFAVSFRF